jgi:hypothetical protein
VAASRHQPRGRTASRTGPTVKTQAETEHDFRVDLIVTPDEVIACGAPRRPPGLMWEQLDAAKIAAIPALASLVPGRP